MRGGVEGHSAKRKQVSFNNYNFCMEDTFPQEAKEEQIIHVNEKALHIGRRDEHRTRFRRLDSEFPVMNGATLSPLLFFPYRGLLFVSEHCNLTIYGLQGTASSLSLSSSLCDGASNKRRVTACHIIMQFTANRRLSWRISIFVQLSFKLFTEKKWEFLVRLVSTCCLYV